MNVEKCVDFLRGKTGLNPQIALILGSGLAPIPPEDSNTVTINYKEIPDFPTTTTPGHKGELIFSSIQGKQLITMNGRFHYYEGYTPQQIAFPVRVMKRLGVETIIITNAAGGINPDFTPGDLMVITDHIKLFGDSPLRGANDPTYGERFNSMCSAYPKELRDIAFESAYGMSLPLKEGVYAYMPGPSYETPAEIRALKILGADAVGMSTVYESIAANHAGMKVLGISCITNMAAGILDQPLSHEEVLNIGQSSKEQFCRLIRDIVIKLRIEN